ncbi:hypothetical protein FACS189432_01770 [Bacteroidia bacterium]|nr:hypothetical protein FACS189432_01770 [Bacteroidia bacterium]
MTYFVSITANFQNTNGVVSNFQRTYCRNISVHSHVAIHQFVMDARQDALNINQPQQLALTIANMVAGQPYTGGNVANAHAI